MHSKYFFFLIILFGIFLGLQACSYEKLPAEPTTCNITTSTYSQQVKPLLERYCTSCHAGSTPSGAIRLDSYAAVSVVVKNGRLLGSIQHLSGYPAMPQGASKLSTCDIELVKKWIEAGASNN